VKKQLRFDTDEVYLSYIGKSNSSSNEKSKINLPQYQ